MGMLSTCAYILAMDTFGPIVDNAGGIVEMSGESEESQKRVSRLDSAGNTTKALTKGYAVGSAALSAFLLFSAYMDEVAAITGKAFTVVNLATVSVFCGAMLGAMLVFLFSALAIRAVGETAQYIIIDVRRQFKNPGILAGTVKPDYASCVDITTKGALKNMILPGAIAVALPVFVGYVLKYEAMAAFLMVATITGVLMALVLNNAGGAWDNAKKYIETGAGGGKGSDTHKAAVVGDTVGDPSRTLPGHPCMCSSSCSRRSLLCSCRCSFKKSFFVLFHFFEGLFLGLTRSQIYGQNILSTIYLMQRVDVDVELVSTDQFERK